MVQTYKRKTQQKQYGEGQLQRAMEMVQSGDMSKRQAFIQLGIPRSTLAKRMKQPGYEPMSLGRFKRVFNNESERELVEYATEMQNRFYGLTISDLRFLAYQLAQRNGLQHPFSHELKMAEWLGTNGLSYS